MLLKLASNILLVSWGSGSAKVFLASVNYCSWGFFWAPIASYTREKYEDEISYL